MACAGSAEKVKGRIMKVWIFIADMRPDNKSSFELKANVSINDIYQSELH